MKYSLAIILIGALIIGGWLYFAPEKAEPVQDLYYRNDTYGFSFSYPQGYVLSESEQGGGIRGHYVITLVQEADAVPRENSEGPTGVTIEVFQNNLDNLSLYGWLTGINSSNFKLSNGTYASTTVAGQEAVSYGWSGLYEAKTNAFILDTNIISVTATYITPTDHSLDTYDKVVATFAPRAILD